MTRDAYKLLHNGILAFARAERQGFRLDVNLANKQSAELTKTIDELIVKVQVSKFYRHWEHVSKGKVNIDSNPQLSWFLYKVKKLKPVKTTTSGQGSTDLEALEALDIPELTDLLRARKLRKLRDTYLESFLREVHNGYIHPSYNLHTTITYRSSSDSPNFQNIPVRDEEAKSVIRKCLFPRKGHLLLEVDYSGIEVRIAACYHKDPTMLKYIRDPKTDMHRDMAQQIYFLKDFIKADKVHHTLRYGAKNGFVFPQFYGDYYGNNAPPLAKWAGMPLSGKWQKKDGVLLPNGITTGSNFVKNGIDSFPDFIEHIKAIENHFWTKRFPVYNEWRNKWWASYQKKGFMNTKTGFTVSGVMDRNQVINSPVQGSAFHCLLWSFIQLDKIRMKRKWDTKLIGQIHDSIIFDVHPDELQEVLQTAKQVTTVDLPNAWPWIIVPLDIEAEVCKVDQSWYYKEEIKF